MVFSSLSFLGIFLPVTILLYIPFSRNIRAGNYILILMSIIFYAWGDLKALPLLIILSVTNYISGIFLSKEKLRKFFLCLSVFINLSALIFFKIAVNASSYSVFFHKSIPLGISFFTFQNLSYLIDIYKKPSNASPTFSRYFLYIMFFPQMIAGPIVKYRDVQTQLEKRSFGTGTLFLGLHRFSIGLFKKTVLAESLSVLSDAMFDSGGNLPLLYAWLGAFSYAFQIYYDFSGYSDMAVGLAGMFGFTYPSNFNHPYMSLSVSEFFRRWHITLSEFFREYVYIPLGGSRRGLKRTIINTLVVFLLTGLWHGIGITYIAWGLICGLIVCLEKAVSLQCYKLAVPSGLRRYVTFITITLSWVMFRAPSFHTAMNYYAHMFMPDFRLFYGTFFYRFVNIRYMFLLIMSLLFEGSKVYLNSRVKKLTSNTFFKAILTVILYLSSIFVLIQSTYKPFIYFKF